MRPRARHRRTALFLGAGASAAFGRPTTDGILPQIRAGLRDETLLPLASNRRRERAKMARLREHLTTLLPSFFDEDVELPLITDVLSLVDLLLTTGEVAVPMFSTSEMEDLRVLLEEAIIETIEKGAGNEHADEMLDRLTDWMLNVPD